MAERLKQRGETSGQHWEHLTAQAGAPVSASACPDDPPGTAITCAAAVDAARIGNAFLTGDAAGLATRDLCEGIGPAIRSGQRAAEAILQRARITVLDDVTGASLGGGLVSRWMDWAFTRGADPGPPANGFPPYDLQAGRPTTDAAAALSATGCPCRRAGYSR